MKLGQQLKIKQNQSLIMTPQLQQAIKLLQLTNLELRQFLEEQTFDNPFIDVEEESNASEKNDVGVSSSEKNDSNSEQVLSKEITDFSDDPTNNDTKLSRTIEFLVRDNNSDNVGNQWSTVITRKLNIVAVLDLSLIHI